MTLSATVTSSAGTVNEGKVAFLLFDSNGNTVGSTASGSVTSNGTATVSYGLPSYTLVGSYTIEAYYGDSANNFSASSDNAHIPHRQRRQLHNHGQQRHSQFQHNPSNRDAERDRDQQRHAGNRRQHQLHALG